MTWKDLYMKGFNRGPNCLYINAKRIVIQNKTIGIEIDFDETKLNEININGTVFKKEETE